MVVDQLVRASNCILIAYGWETQMALDRASSHANFFLIILRNTNTLKVLQVPTLFTSSTSLQHCRCDYLMGRPILLYGLIKTDQNHCEFSIDVTFQK